MVSALERWGAENPSPSSAASNWIFLGARHHMNEQSNEARSQGFSILNSREMSRIKRRRELGGLVIMSPFPAGEKHSGTSEATV